MAITAEQATAIATAIENLNKSVQVNEEVLQIIKSMQTTGAAGSVAEHEADKNAHAGGIDILKILDALYVKSRTFSSDPSEKGNPWALRLGATLKHGDFGNAAVSLYSRLEPNVNNYFPAVLFENSVTDDFTDESATRSLGKIQVRSRNKSDSGYEYRGVIDFGYNAAVKDYCIRFSAFPKNKETESTGSLYLYPGLLCSSLSMDLGSSTYQWKDLYIQNSPIVSSDRRLKQDFAEVPEAVFKAWGSVKFCQYRFKEAVSKKGAEARLHVGLIAQEIVEAFTAQGLDATAYGIVCHDSWDDQYEDVEVSCTPAVLNEKGEVVKPEEPIMEHRLIKPAGDLWTVRYEEALALEAAYQRWKLQKIEAALVEKGITL